MNDAQLDIEAMFKQHDFRPMTFQLRSGKSIAATRDPTAQRWTLLRDRVPISGGPFTDDQARERLIALAGQAIGLIRVW